jgi:glycosyltransferase, family 1
LEWKIRDSTNNLPANLTVEMTGPMNNENVHKLLSTRHIDASLLLSESEGGVPVSMAESLSYGIPIITTSVGDLSEVTLKSGGLLLSGNLTTDEFCSKMNVFIPRLPLLRSYAVEFWRQHLDATPLRESWTKELASHIKPEQE